MLVQFSVGNYRSFKDVVSLNLRASSLKSKYPELDELTTFDIRDNVQLLKSAVIYGANASGKSNLFLALIFMYELIINSARESQVTDSIQTEPFRLVSGYENQPSFFELVFYLDNVLYRYGFEVSQDKVHKEWLFHTHKRESVIFMREDDHITMPMWFKQAEGSNLDKLTRDNALFLSVLAQWNSQTAKKILSWIAKTHIIESTSLNLSKDLIRFSNNLQIQNDISRFISEMDVGIQRIIFNSHELGSEEDTLLSFQTISTFHIKYNEQGKPISTEEFLLSYHESAGTQKLFILIAWIIENLKIGHPVFVDELDARLHPLITRAIIQLFHSKETNPHNAQLIFATHDTNHLDNRVFRRDQIWFTEKDQFGATDLYSLVEYRVRNDASFESDYIAGKYGAIPFLGDFSNLLEKTEA